MLKQKAAFVPQRGERSPALSPVRRETVQSNSWCIACPYVCSDCRVLLYAAVTLTHHANAVIFLFFKHVCCVDFTSLFDTDSRSFLNQPATLMKICPLLVALLPLLYLFSFSFFVLSFQVTERINEILLQEKKVVPTVVLSCFFFCVAFVCVVYGCVGWPMPPGVDVFFVFCVLLLFLFFAIQSQ